MPYINKQDKEILDELMKPLLERFKQAGVPLAYDGEMNYVITKLLLNFYDGYGYQAYNRAMGVLECAKQEFYRRKIAPYEDEKIKQNGDIICGI